jgi:purine-cytosine permease-like protein
MTAHPASKQYDAVGHIETRGVDFIPNAERHSSPMNIFWILIGANLSIGMVVIGFLPVSFGLSWWGAATSIILGNAIGAFMLAPVAMLGVRSGSNGPVTSGAFFGVVGRIIGSVIGALICLGFYALAVWTGGQAAIAGLHKLAGLPSNNLTLAVSYAIIALVCSLVAIWGHASMVFVERLMIPIAGLLLVVGLFVYAPDFHASYKGGSYLLGTFWPTWGLSVTICAVAAYGYSPLISDWTRYISPKKYSSASVLSAAWIGCFVGLNIPFLFGAFTAVAIISTKLDYVPGLVAMAPLWYMVPLVIIGVIGTFGQGSVCLYSSGLDFSSIFPVFKRPMATTLLSIIAVILVIVGSMIGNAEASVTAFLQVIGVGTAAWMAIIIIGHYHRKGYYEVHDLQVFNRRETGGVYWYTGGWNLRAVVAFVVGVTIGLLALQCSFYTGPLSNMADGVDLSWASGFVIAGLIYGAAIMLFPEHSGVHGDAGAAERLELAAQGGDLGFNTETAAE